MSTLQEIILETVKRGIPVGLGYDEEANRLWYEVAGFAKSGNVRIEEIDNLIIVRGRYNTVREIETFQDLAYIAKGWYDNYKDRGYPVDSYWLNVFVEYGQLTRIETSVVSYV